MLSIIIPTYNSECTIKRCIESILQIKNIRYELILIDDGSSDNSLDINNNYSKHYKNIYSFYQNHLGPSEARNLGIKQAKGDWICFIDSDDYINPKIFCKVLKQCLSPNVDLLVSNIFLNGNVLGVSKNNYFSNIYIYLKDNYPLYKNELIHVVWNKIFKRSIIKKYDIKFNNNVSMGEDFLFNLQYLMHVKRLISQTNRIYYIYYVHKSSITNKFEKKALYNQLKILNSIKLVYHKYHIYCKFDNLKVRIIHHIMLNVFKKNQNRIGYLRNQKIRIKLNKSLSNINIFDLNIRNVIFLIIFLQPSMHIFYICNYFKQLFNEFI